MARESEAEEAAYKRADGAAKRIEEWRSNLLKLAAGSIPEIDEVSFLGRELRAAATIATMAELEGLLRDMLISVGAHVNKAGISYRDLKPSLRSLAAHSEFESLVATRDSGKVWGHRQVLTHLDDSDDLAILPSRTIKTPQPPLDGRTIQPRHISLIWSVLGIHDPIPSASTVASLKKLTQLRNDVAHRNVEIHVAFSEPGRTARNIAKYLDDVLLLTLHIGVEWGTYITNQSYLRRP